MLIPNAPLITIMVLSQAVNGVLLPFLLIFMMIIVNDRRIMGRYVNGRVYNVTGLDDGRRRHRPDGRASRRCRLWG